MAEKELSVPRGLRERGNLCPKRAPQFLLQLGAGRGLLLLRCIPGLSLTPMAHSAEVHGCGSTLLAGEEEQLLQLTEIPNVCSSL